MQLIKSRFWQVDNDKANYKPIIRKKEFLIIGLVSLRMVIYSHNMLLFAAIWNETITHSDTTLMLTFSVK